MVVPPQRGTADDPVIEGRRIVEQPVHSEQTAQRVPEVDRLRETRIPPLGDPRKELVTHEPEEGVAASGAREPGRLRGSEVTRPGLDRFDDGRSCWVSDTHDEHWGN